MYLQDVPYPLRRLTEKQMVDETMTLASELRIREIVRDELGTLKRNVDNPL